MSETNEPKRPAPPALKSYQPITKVKSLQELFEHPDLRNRMEKVLPNHLNADRMVRTMVNAAMRNKDLLKVSPVSMLGAAMTLGYLGLEPNTPLQLVHLIPFEVNWNPQTKKREYIRTDVQIIIGYQGYIDLIGRAGKVRDIDCQVVWPGDVLEHEHGTNKHFKHIERHKPRVAGQEPDFAYMHARMIGEQAGEYVELLSRADVHHVRASSQGFRSAMFAHDAAVREGKDPNTRTAYRDSPWIKFPVAMWRKTALRAGQKWLPKSAELATAIALDEASDDGRVRFENIIDAHPDDYKETISGGAWEEPESEGDGRDPSDQEQGGQRQTQVQVKTADATQGASTQQTRPPVQRKATAKAAATDQGGPPDDRFNEDPGWTPPGTAARTAATQAPANPAPRGNPARSGEAQGADTQADAPTPGEGGTAPSSSGGSAPTAFEAWLLDVNGEPVADSPHEDPVGYVAQLEEMIARTPASRVAILEQNADGIADAVAASQQAASIIRDLRTDPAADNPDEDEAMEDAGITVVQLTYDRGKPVVKAYLDAFKAEVANLTAETALDFIALNMPEMRKVPPSTISLCLSALVKQGTAAGFTVPPSLGPELLQREPATPQATANDETAEDPDWQNARNRIVDINKHTDVHELEAFARGIIMKSLGERLKREGKTDIVRALEDAYSKRLAELKGA